MNEPRTPTLTSLDASRIEADDGYQALLDLVRSRVASASPPLFQTAATGLFPVFLGNLPADRRQHYTCTACRRFVDQYGSLVRLHFDGEASTILWEPDEVPTFFAASVAAVRHVVLAANVTGVYLSSAEEWGTPRTGPWFHLSGPNPAVFAPTLQTAVQAMAEKREDYGVLCRALAEFSRPVVEQAVRVLQADAMTRSEKGLAVARWFLDLHQRIDGLSGKKRSHVVRLAAAQAPTGFCHVKNQVVGTLLEDLAAGLPFATIQARWAAKLHPLQYQRPTTISDGNVKQAEELVAKLGVTAALARRFARLADVVPLWTPRPLPAEARPGGVFGHLLQSPGRVEAVQLPARTVTWEKFARTILPDALDVQCWIPGGLNAFVGLITAADPTAPPILQWDDEPRNPVSWYFYHGGSQATHWGLRPSSWVPVQAICLKPPLWHHPERFAHQGRDVFFLLQGCRDQRYTVGAGWFPETLKAEFHGVRKVMEAHAARSVVAGLAESDANGLALGQGGRRVRVVTAGGPAIYDIDRWD